MTTPGAPYSGGYSHTWGQSRPPFEDTAASAIAQARQHLGIEGQRPPLPPRLSAADREEAEKAAKKRENVCAFCIGLHPMPNGPGCPRIASFEMDGDGKVKSATYWPGLEWAKGRVVLAEDALEDGAEEEAGDGER